MVDQEDDYSDDRSGDGEEVEGEMLELQRDLPSFVLSNLELLIISTYNGMMTNLDQFGLGVPHHL